MTSKSKKKKPAKKNTKSKKPAKKARKAPGKPVGRSKKTKPDPEPETVTEQPAGPVNPFLGQQFITDDKAVSVMVTDQEKGKKVTQTVTHYEKISKAQALGYFCQAIKEQLDMTSGGIKTFMYLYSKVHFSEGLNAENMSLYVDKANCMQEAKYTSIQSVFNGINELISKGIIAKTGKINVYFLNPNFFRPADFLIVTEYFKVNDEASTE